MTCQLSFLLADKDIISLDGYTLYTGLRYFILSFLLCNIVATNMLVLYSSIALHNSLFQEFKEVCTAMCGLDSLKHVEGASCALQSA